MSAYFCSHPKAQSTDLTLNAQQKHTCIRLKLATLINGSNWDYSILLWIDNCRTNEAGQQRSVHMALTSPTSSLSTQERVLYICDTIHLRLCEAVSVLFEITNKFVHQGHKFGLVGIHHLLNLLPKPVWAFLSKEFFLLSWGEPLNQLVWVDLQVIFIFTQAAAWSAHVK